ncbi:hypothetical protein [Joostella sp. CR20]
MTTKEASEILQQFNRWRRDVNVPSKYKPPRPTLIGQAIDKAIEVLKENN